MRKTYLFACICIALAVQAEAQKTTLGPDQYFKNNFKGIVQPLPMVEKWVDDKTVVIRRDGKSFLLDCKSLAETPYTAPPTEKGSVPVKPMIVAKSNNLYQRKNVEDVQLTFDEAKEINPTVSPDGNYVAFTRNNDLYTINLNTKKETRLTSDGSETILNGYASWVYMEEILGRASQYRSFWWSPDSKQIAFFRTDDSRVPVFTMTDGTGTRGGYVETMRYPKVGDPNPEVKVGMISADGGTIQWAPFNEKDDQYFGQPYWRPDGKALWVQWMNRGQDELVVYEVDGSGSKKEIYRENQKTWINLDDNDRIEFLESGKGFLLLSDKSGWKNIYLHDMNGKQITNLTPGAINVLGIGRVDEKAQFVYFQARSLDNTARTQVYRVRLNGKELTRLTPAEFTNDANLSPGGSYLVARSSNVSTPPRMLLIDKKGKILKELATAKAPDFDNTELAKAEFIRVKSDDGKYDLPMKVTWPLNMDKSKKYPVLISIYGGPDAGTCWDSWQLNGKQQFYAKEGLIQVVMDHRASGHFGKEGVNNMHRNLGYWEMKDYTTLVNWLIANGQADPSKIAITGYSYGGYVSCYALTYGAGTFTHGLAGGSVTDWTLYDSHYTERLMDTDKENPEGYKSASVLTHTDKYKGMLQIVHGIIDENVHLQNSVQLATKLQAGKKEFEMQYYSGNRHGIRGAAAPHYENLKTKFIYKYLLGKEVPPQMLQ
jgi:dipeptidyl-peptidase 4